MGRGASRVEAGADDPPRPFAFGRLWQQTLNARSRAAELDEALIILSLLSLCVLVRLLWLLPIDVYWDAAAKWHFARQWSYANDFSRAQWSHHMARVGVNVPTYLVQQLFGTATRDYYVLPLGAFALQTLLVYLLARRLSGRAAGVLGALFMCLSTAMTRTASQLLPDGIAGGMVVLAGYCLVRFHEEEGTRRRRWLVGLALSCCWAYAIKESCVLLLPGVGLAVLLSRRNFKEVLLVAGIIAAYALLETLAFNVFTDYPHRLAIVQEKHGYYPPTTFFGLFERFGRLEPAAQVMFWTWLVAALSHAGGTDKRRRLLLILPVGFVFFLTFLVRRVDPITVWQSAKPRYMAPVMSLMVVSAAVFVAEAAMRAGEGWQPLKRAGAFCGERPGLTTFCVCVVLGALVYAEKRPYLTHHPLATQPRAASILNDAFRRNLPIIERARNPRGLNTIYGVYLRPRYLAQSDVAHDGRLPNIQEGVRLRRIGEHEQGYILRDASKYRRGELEKAVARGCAVVVKAPGYVSLSVSEKLPERCRAPRGADLQR